MIQELTGKDRLHTADDGIVLLARKPTPTFPRPLTTSSGTSARPVVWTTVRACSYFTCRSLPHAPLDAGLPLDSFLPPWRGTRTRTLGMLERFCWCVANNVFAR